MDRVRTWIKARPIDAFFILAFVLSWLTTPLFYYTRSQYEYTSIYDALRLLRGGGWGLVMVILAPFVFSLGPMIAAVVVTIVEGGKPGFRAYIARITRWRVGFQWYLVAFLLTATLNLTATVLIPTLLGRSYDFQLLTSSAQEIGLIWLVQFYFGNLEEELGWRGYALPKLQDKFNPVVSSLILGGLWALWHFPLWYALPYAPLSFLNILVLTFLITWLYNNTHSAFLTALFYATTSTVHTVNLTVWGSGATAFWVELGLTTLLAALLVYYDRKFLVNPSPEKE
jgi:membrane protease YdiL (CAAX protease family)